MRILCALGWHQPREIPVWNDGYYFSSCEECRRDLVRTAFERWHTVPRGHQLVWAPLPPENRRTAKLTELSLPAERSTRVAPEESTDRNAAELGLPPAASGPTDAVPEVNDPVAESSPPQAPFMLSEKVGAAEDGDQALRTEQDWRGPSISEVLLLLRIEELRSQGGVEPIALTDEEFSTSSPDATDTQTGKLNQGAPVPSDLSEESPVRTSEASSLLLDQIASAPEEQVDDQSGESEDAGTAGEPDHDPSASFDALDAEHAEINSKASPDGDPVDAVLIERGSEAPGPPLPAANSELDDFMKDGGEVDDGLAFWAEESSNQAQGEDADRIASASSTPPTYEHEIRDGIGLKQVTEPEDSPEPEEVAAQEPLATARQATPKADSVRSWPSAAPSLRRTRILGMDDSIPNRDWTPWVVAGALLLLLLVLVSIPRGVSKRAEDLASSSRPNAAQVDAVESGSAGGARSAFVSVRLLKCRASPGQGARVAGILPRGAPIKVLATDRGWASIAYRGRQCWAWARYITTERPL